MNDVDSVLSAVGLRRRGDKQHVTWFGEAVGQLIDPVTVDRLATIMYSSAYIKGVPEPVQTQAEYRLDPEWHTLRADDRLSARWGGWSRALDDHLTAPGEPVIKVPEQMSSEAGLVSLSMPALTTEALLGWMMIRHGDIRYSSGLIRFYVNSTPHEVISAIPAVVSALLAEHFPHFYMKFLMTQDHVERADSSVIYLPRYPRDELLSGLATALAPAVVSNVVPMFTLTYAPGFALADSPPDGGSFGHGRCRQVAQAFVDGMRSNSNPALMLPFDRKRPWNNPAGPSLESLRPPAVPGRSRRPVVDPAGALQILARTLSETAIRAEGVASWLVRDVSSGRQVATGAEVYSGSAGALLALAYATRLDSSRRHLDLMRATARGMVSRQPELPASGFHCGQAGTAAVLAEAALRSQDPAMMELAEESLSGARAAQRGEVAWDVVAGTAGTILGLHAAGTFLKVDVAEDLAVLAQQLKAAAEPDPSGGLRWRSRIGRRRPVFQGLAHGRSGAMLGLAVTSPTPAGWDLIRQSIFKDADADAAHRASAAGWVEQAPGHPQAPTTWCHGLAGIGVTLAAMSRRLSEVILDQTASLKERVSRTFTDPLPDRGLCHGVSGLALALAVMGNVFDDGESRAMAKEWLKSSPSAEHTGNVTLMNGAPGTLLARLAIAGIAPAPIAFVLDPIVFDEPR